MCKNYLAKLLPYITFCKKIRKYMNSWNENYNEIFIFFKSNIRHIFFFDDKIFRCSSKKSIFVASIKSLLLINLLIKNIVLTYLKFFINYSKLLCILNSFNSLFFQNLIKMKKNFPFHINDKLLYPLDQ